MYTIKVLEENGELKKEAKCEGFLICAFDERKEIDGNSCCVRADVMACEVSTMEIMAVTSTEGSPLNDAHEALMEIEKAKKRMGGFWRRLFGKK